MSSMYLQEYSSMGHDDAGHGSDRGDVIQVPKEPSLADQKITISAASPLVSTPSAAFNGSTKFICVHCDANAHIKIAAATSPVVAAAVTDKKLIADTDYYFAVTAGHQIAVYPA